MNTAPPLVVPIFATPFGVASLPDSAALNPVLAALFSERAAADRASPAGTRALSYRSRDDLFEWTDEPVRKLARGIVEAVVAVVRSINDFSDTQFAAFSIQTRAWYSIVRPDGCMPSTNYPNAAWCALYCVAAPPPATVRFDSGVLRLHESFRATMFSDATTTLTHMPYRPGHNTWLPVPGQLAVFPAAITHEIATVRAAGELVLVSALVRFVAPGQTGMPWW